MNKVDQGRPPQTLDQGRPPQRRYAVLTAGFLTDNHAKTAHGVIRYGRDDVVAIVDPVFAGQDLRDVLPHLGRSAPIVGDVAGALAFHPTSLLVGVAPQGGKMPAAFRAHIRAAIDAGLEIVSGLHELLNEDDEFAAAARASGSRLWDVRVPPPDIPLYSGAARDVPYVVVLAVGTDCSIGKMSVMLELERAARESNARADFVATGQTGIMIAGHGIAVDRVISDFVTGAAEQLVLGVTAGTEIALVEGQGSIIHPAYAPVTLGLLFGSSPDALVMCHQCGREAIEGYGVAIGELAPFIKLHEALLAPIKPAAVVAVALNTASLDEQQARAAIAHARAATGLPADDVVRFGAAGLWRAVSEAAAATPKRADRRAARTSVAT